VPRAPTYSVDNPTYGFGRSYLTASIKRCGSAISVDWSYSTKGSAVMAITTLRYGPNVTSVAIISRIRRASFYTAKKGALNCLLQTLLTAAPQLGLYCHPRITRF
jgi:hypothetical protein